ncbi:MAG TPA: T9SS type A sorting domain-containing protein [Bacteroidota bacterium]|nr:T9SS type A sorting domain-containing protein [Bacteroidota bacterium]
MKKIFFLFILGIAAGTFLFLIKQSEQKEADGDERLESTVGDHDDPDAALRFRYQILAGNQEGKVDLEKLRRDAVTATRSMRRPFGVLEKTTSLAWSALGPGNIGGRVRSIVINPTNSSQIIIGSVSGGIWKSIDGGASWKPKSDSLDFLAISSLLIDPTNSNIVYAGTGEGWTNLDAVYGGGIYKSTDFGDTWSLLSSTSGSSATHFRAVMKLAADPQGNIYAATKDYNYEYGLGEYTTAGGLYKSTDKGTSWSKISSSTLATDYFNPFDVIPISSTLIVYAVGSNGSTLGGIYRTTDGGTTWGEVSSNLPTSNYRRIALAQDPSSANTLYAVFESLDVTSGGDGGLKGIYKSTDGGATWNSISSPQKIASTASSSGNLSYLGTQGWYDNVIAVDPNNSSTIIVGGIDLMKSTNGGSSWSQLTYWNSFYGTPTIHADHHVILFDKNNPGTILNGSDGGVYLTTNGGTSWTSLNNGLAITQFYGGAVTNTGATYFGGTQDNGHLKYSGSGSSWTTEVGGDGGYAAQDQTNNLVSYEEYVYLQMSKTTDGGAHWNNCITGLTDAKDNSKCLFIAPFAMDVDNSSVLIAGSTRVWLTTNSAGSWSAMSKVLPASGYDISAVTLASASSPYLAAVGTSHGEVFLCTSLNPASDTMNVWNSITPAGNNGAWVRRVIIDPSNHNRIFVCYAGYNTSGTLASRHVWESTNQGSSWTDISTALPNVPVHTLVIDPNSSSTLYVGTETGIYTTANNGTTWSASTSGMPLYAPTDDLELQGGTKELFAFTHGRGVFSTGTVNGVDAKDAATPTEFALSQNYPNPFNPQTRIQFAIPQASHVSLKIFNSVGQEVARLVDDVVGAGTHDVDWNGRDNFGRAVSSGVYFYRLVAGDFVTTKKMLLVK